MREKGVGIHEDAGTGSWGGEQQGGPNLTYRGSELRPGREISAQERGRVHAITVRIVGPRIQYPRGNPLNHLSLSFHSLKMGITTFLAS